MCWLSSYFAWFLCCFMDLIIWRLLSPFTKTLSQESPCLSLCNLIHNLILRLSLLCLSRCWEERQPENEVQMNKGGKFLKKLSPSLWRRANARNVSFITRYGGQFTFQLSWYIQITWKRGCMMQQKWWRHSLVLHNRIYNELSSSVCWECGEKDRITNKTVFHN